MKEREQTQTGGEHDNNGQDTAQDGTESPCKNNKLGGGLTETLLKDYELGVKEPAGEQAPWDGEAKQCDGVDAKCALILLE